MGTSHKAMLSRGFLTLSLQSYATSCYIDSRKGERKKRRHRPRFYYYNNTLQLKNPISINKAQNHSGSHLYQQQSA